MRPSRSRNFLERRRSRTHPVLCIKSMAGYSGTPLIQKIGIKPGHRVILRHHPASFIKDLRSLPEGAESTDRLSGKANVLVYFTDKRSALAKDFSRLAETLEPDGMLWIRWPKKSSGRK